MQKMAHRIMLPRAPCITVPVLLLRCFTLLLLLRPLQSIIVVWISMDIPTTAALLLLQHQQQRPFQSPKQLQQRRQGSPLFMLPLPENDTPSPDEIVFADKKISRRTLLTTTIQTTSTAIIAASATTASSPAFAKEQDIFQKNPALLDPRAIVTIQINSSKDKLGLQLANTQLRGKSIVVIQNVVSQTKNTKSLEPGMILLNYATAQDVIDQIKNGPYPIELQFYNLAAGGDAFNDLGRPMVTAQDALDLAKQTESSNTNTNTKNSNSIGGGGGGGGGALSKQETGLLQEEYSITTLGDNTDSVSSCAIQSRRGDLLEIEYEAAALVPSITDTSSSSISNQQSQPIQKIIYDASAFRGTGMPYQMVLGSADMLPGVDQGLYDMCPGQVRRIKIPPRLAYGSRGNKLFKIPPNTPLEWTVKLISIDGTIRQENNANNLGPTRDEREGRALY